MRASKAAGAPPTAPVADGAGAGLDGWSGLELADLPHEFFCAFATKCPFGARSTAGPQDGLRDARHISTKSSSRGRALSRCKPKTCVQFPYCQFGTACFLAQSPDRPPRESGFPELLPPTATAPLGRKVLPLLWPRLHATDLNEGAAAIALELARCFDYSDPRVRTEVLRLHRCPEPLVC